MGKNLMPEVAKLLGVEIGEEFKIKEMPHDVYQICENILKYKLSNQGWGEATEDTLKNLLRGEMTIVNLPFKPKSGRTYWTVEEDSILCDSWDNDMMDYSYLKLGNCFRTKEEAKANADRIRKEIMG